MRGDARPLTKAALRPRDPRREGAAEGSQAQEAVPERHGNRRSAHEQEPQGARLQVLNGESQIVRRLATAALAGEGRGMTPAREAAAPRIPVRLFPMKPA